MATTEMADEKLEALIKLAEKVASCAFDARQAADKAMLEAQTTENLADDLVRELELLRND